MNFCTQCGQLLQRNLKFCTSCGRALASTQSEHRQDLAALANSNDADVRSHATRTIIAEVDIDSMRRAGFLAIERADQALGEFWFMEIATAEADGRVRAEGIELLARQVLIPAGRLEEAALYSRHAAEHPDREISTRARHTLAEIEQAWSASGLKRLHYSEEWRHIDVSQPMPRGLSQQDLYLVFLAHLFARDLDGMNQQLLTGLQEDYMQSITGMIIGLSRTSDQTGMTRETGVKAITDWLDHRQDTGER